MVSLTKMVGISIAVNLVIMFLVFAGFILPPPLSFVAGPFSLVGFVMFNMIMFLVCLFKCEMPHFGGT